MQGTSGEGLGPDSQTPDLRWTLSSMLMSSRAQPLSTHALGKASPLRKGCTVQFDFVHLPMFASKKNK